LSGARPGELDALRREWVRFSDGEVDIREQWNVKVRRFTEPEYGPYTIALVGRARELLLNMPRDDNQSPFVFVTNRGHHYSPSSRTHHWNRVRCAARLPDMTLYLATRHYFGWYALNVLGVEPHVIAGTARPSRRWAPPRTALWPSGQGPGTTTDPGGLRRRWHSPAAMYRERRRRVIQPRTGHAGRSCPAATAFVSDSRHPSLSALRLPASSRLSLVPSPGAPCRWCQRGDAAAGGRIVRPITRSVVRREADRQGRRCRGGGGCRRQESRSRPKRARPPSSGRGWRRRSSPAGVPTRG
jgi:hypothetical protein